MNDTGDRAGAGAGSTSPAGIAKSVGTMPASVSAGGARPRREIADARDNVAASLRQAYQAAIDETVPDSIADLLKRLS